MVRKGLHERYHRTPDTFGSIESGLGRRAKYDLTDGAYAQLLHHLSLRNFDLLTPDLKDAITNYYSDLNAPFATKKSTDGWQITLQELGKLKAATPAPVQTPVSSSSKRAVLD